MPDYSKGLTDGIKGSIETVHQVQELVTLGGLNYTAAQALEIVIGLLHLTTNIIDVVPTAEPTR